MLAWLAPVWRDINHRLGQGKLHHGLIFHGKHGTGKDMLCRQLATLLLCQSRASQEACGQCQSCKLMKAESHPDFNYIASQTSIGVDAVREAIAKLLHTSQLGGSKILIINEAQRMTVAAANALLKTLEEPTANTYIMLTCQSLHELLPTVLSRCEKHAVVVHDRQAVQAWLSSQHLTANAEIMDLYWQKPLFLKEMLEDEGDNVIPELEAIASGKAVSALPASFFENPALILDWLQHWLKQQLMNGNPPVELQELLFGFSQKLQTYKSRCAQQGANKKLQLSLCMADFAKISATVQQRSFNN